MTKHVKSEGTDIKDNFCLVNGYIWGKGQFLLSVSVFKPIWVSHVPTVTNVR